MNYFISMMIRQQIWAKVKVVASRAAYRLRGNRPSRRQVEEHEKMQQRYRAMETEAEQRRNKLPELSQELKQLREEKFGELERILDHDGLLSRYTREQLMSSPRIFQFEARLLFYFAMMSGKITDMKYAREEFKQWLGKLNVKAYCDFVGQVSGSQPNPEMILRLKENPQMAFNNLRLDRGSEHKANQAMDWIIKLNNNQDPREQEEPK